VDPPEPGLVHPAERSAGTMANAITELIAVIPLCNWRAATLARRRLPEKIDDPSPYRLALAS